MLLQDKIDIIKNNIMLLDSDAVTRRREIADISEALPTCPISSPEYKKLQDKFARLNRSVANINMYILTQKQILKHLYEQQHTK